MTPGCIVGCYTDNSYKKKWSFRKWCYEICRHFPDFRHQPPQSGSSRRQGALETLLQRIDFNNNTANQKKPLKRLPSHPRLTLRQPTRLPVPEDVTQQTTRLNTHPRPLQPRPRRQGRVIGSAQAPESSSHSAPSAHPKPASR